VTHATSKTPVALSCAAVCGGAGARVPPAPPLLACAGTSARARRARRRRGVRAARAAGRGGGGRAGAPGPWARPGRAGRARRPSAGPRSRLPAAARRRRAAAAAPGARPVAVRAPRPCERAGGSGQGKAGARRCSGGWLALACAHGALWGGRAGADAAECVQGLRPRGEPQGDLVSVARHVAQPCACTCYGAGAWAR